ncbi:BrnT family toxin [Rhodoferax aquaticus]|uniref:BrnT family toxin n=1 Tax=Rhodoferax aquaticus TaxID=2527691 RepID=A0A515ESK7_9BURK|nr:BrnT family toxin [Rhodoferax aquaticus]QDL55652.1 BrnT family toxin [Rhodoferax aquaticus]
MQIEFDSQKREKTLAERGLDFARAAEVFAGPHFTGQDERTDYAEDRFITVGLLDARLVVLVWTPRGKVRRMISMRKANDREKAYYARYMD